MNGLIKIISDFIGNDKIATMLMSVIPLIELKGGIVFARGTGLNFLYSFGLAYIGSTIAFFPVYFLLKPILNLLKRIKAVKRFAEKVENYFNEKAKKTLNNSQNGKTKAKSEVFYKMLGVLIFVAIPLPMTGVWTGTAIAVFLNLKLKDAVLPVVVGNLIAGLIISAIAELCIAIWNINCLNYILYGLLVLAVIILVITIVKVGKQKTQEKRED